MDGKELEDIAYEIATSNCTIKVLNKEEWEKIDTESIIWEPFENNDVNFTESIVSDIASSIINKFDKFVTSKEIKNNLSDLQTLESYFLHIENNDNLEQSDPRYISNIEANHLLNSISVLSKEEQFNIGVCIYSIHTNSDFSELKPEDCLEILSKYTSDFLDK